MTFAAVFGGLFLASVAVAAFRRYGQRTLVDVLADRVTPSEGDLVLELQVALGRDEIERLDQAIRGR